MRRTRSGRAALSTGLLAGLLGVVACGGEGDPPASPSRTQRPLTIAAPSDLSGVNELLTSSTFDHEVRSNLFLHLLEERPDYQQHPPTFAPSLAERWEWSSDRLALTFHMRPEATWSDGTPVTAEDVRWTWQAQTDPDVAWAYAYVKESIADVEALGPHTVRFRFTRAYPTQLLEANEGFVLPRHVWGELAFADWRQSADWFRDHLVVSGPFTLGRWERQQELVLERNPRYWRPGLPRLDRVVFRVLPDETARLAQLLAGRIDVVEGVPPSRVAELDARPDVTVHEIWSRQYSYVVWNTRRELFSDPAVRRAMTLAIDRQGLVDALWFGHARVADSPILTSVWAHDDSLEPWPYDPAAARRLLAAAGFADGDGDGVLERRGEPFSFELSASTGGQLRRDALVLIQEQLRRVGVDARPAFYEPQTLTAMNESGDFDATLSGWAIDTSLDVRYAFHSDEIEEGYNFGAYSNPEADRVMDAIAEIPDLGAAQPLSDRLQQILHRDQPYTFLWEPQWLVAVRSRVVGADPSPLLTFRGLQGWRLAPGG